MKKTEVSIKKIKENVCPKGHKFCLSARCWMLVDKQKMVYGKNREVRVWVDGKQLSVFHFI